MPPASAPPRAVALAWVVSALAWGLASPPAAALPSLADIRAAHRPSDITLLDRHGTPVQTLRLDSTARRLPWVPLQDLSPALLQAIVLSEDQRFWQHSGVDWQGVARSAWANLLNTRTQGASTLTMQLAGLIDEGLARPAGGRSVPQKIGQALTATQLEASWRKADILEAYLNAVPFRGELVGVGALSQTLFNKHPSGLDAFEAAIAAALVRSPSSAPERVAERACGVLRLQRLDCTGVAGLTHAALARRGGMPLGEQLAPHFARQVLKADGPARQHSTLDAPLQRTALAALRQQLAELSGRNVEDGAIVVLDNATGAVLAWVGSSGAFSDAPQVDGVLARRQPGSTLKPFVYGLAIEQQLITPATLLDDSPTQLATAGGLYRPQNYDQSYQGWVSARTALGSSLNIPAVRVGAMLGPDAVFERLNAFGLALPESGSYYGHALALGGADVTLLALTNAYRALANGGLLSPVVTHATATGRLPATAPGAAPRRVGDAAAVHLVSHMLADNNARAGTFDLDSQLATRGFAAAKTGTSKDLRDNWCIGYTSRYTVGVWVGNASGAPMHDVSGVSGAAPIWRQLVLQLHAGQPSRAPLAPAGVVQAKVAFEGGREPPRDEVFLAGTAQPLQRTGSLGGAQARGFGIDNPRDGSLYALDPDIPPKAQRITFSGQAGTWWLDGKAIGQGSQVAWAPWPGRHELKLTTPASAGRPARTVQTVHFEVRGATLARPASGTTRPVTPRPSPR